MQLRNKKLILVHSFSWHLVLSSIDCFVLQKYIQSLPMHGNHVSMFGNIVSVKKKDLDMRPL